MKRAFLIILYLFVVLSGKSQTAESLFKDAERLSKIAISKFNNGDVIEADSLIRLSIKTYPTKSIFDYTNELVKTKNIVGCNLIIDLLWKRALDHEEATIIFFSGGSFAKKVAAYHIAVEGYNLNKAYGKRIDIDKYLRLAIVDDLRIVDMPNAALHKIMQKSYEIELYLNNRDYSTALKKLDEIPVEDLPEFGHSQKKAGILMEMCDYKNAEVLAPKLNEYAQVSFKFCISSLVGNTKQAFSYYKKLTKVAKSQNWTNYYLALAYYHERNYTKSIELLERSLIERNSPNAALTGLIDIWKIYTLLGDSYKELSKNERSREYYELAILSDPDYEPAIAALTKLESSIATTTSTDKTPPKIAVTEPSVKRGLQVTTSGSDVMVRGIAEDPSGLKSVSINGQSVYAQASGNFWGNIVLKNGLNKITIKATDGAGNIAEQIFEITKNNTPVTETEIVAVTAKEGKNYCLLIAAQNYTDASIPSLENPIQDAVRLKMVLKKSYRFADEEIFTLFNPSADDIKRQLLELTNIIQPEDNLLIFYAGHGIWVEKEKKGYWLMTDAKRNDPTTWVSNKDVLNLIAKLPSRHTLLITDACFSGGVFKTRSITKDAPSAIQMMDAKVSRVAITSGNDTEVPDQSVFMKYLVKALTENKDQFMPAQKMFITHIMEAVMTEGKTEPRYGTLELAGHVGGDFIFVKK